MCVIADLADFLPVVGIATPLLGSAGRALLPNFPSRKFYLCRTDIYGLIFNKVIGNARRKHDTI